MVQQRDARPVPALIIGEVPRELPVDDEITLIRQSLADTLDKLQFETANRDFLARYDMGAREKTLIGVIEDLEETERQTAIGLKAPYKIMRLGRYAGEVSLHSRLRPTSAVANIGYCLAKSEQSKNIAYRAVGRLLEFGFQDWGLQVVRFDIRPTNDRSQRLAQRLGAQPNERWSHRSDELRDSFPMIYEHWKVEAP